MKITRLFPLLLLAFPFFIHCFGGIDARGSVRSYEQGLVTTEGGSFRVGTLPEYWQRQKIDYRAALLKNSRDGSTITISSWCKGAFDDGSLKELSEQLYSALANYRIIEERMIPLADRDARLTTARGFIDGKEVFLKTYVLKMNVCVFDFAYVSTPDGLGDIGDFDAMVAGFQYVKGPPIL